MRSLRIVVVDDNEDSCEVLEMYLRGAGHEVTSASTAEAALDIFEATRPELAIIDISLPVMNGYELATRLRAKPESKDIVLVALTGYGRASDKSAAMDAGFDNHLVKPLRLEELNVILDRATEGLRAAKQ